MLSPNLLRSYLHSILNVVTFDLLRWEKLLQLLHGLSPYQIERSKPSPGVYKAQYEPFLRGFLRDAKVDMSTAPKPDPQFESALYAEIEPTTSDKRLAKACANIGMLVSIFFFPKHEDDVRYLIGVFTAYFLLVEDSGHLMVDDLAQFRRRLMTHEKQPAVFERMKWLLAELDKSYSSFSANKLFNGIINAWSVFEVEYDQTPGFELSKVNQETASPLFPHYFRNMTGCSEVYVFFLVMKKDCTMPRMRLLLQVTPELINITDEINDLFSFYKESVIDIKRAEGKEIELDNFVYQEAGVSQAPVFDVLQSTARRILDRQALIDTITKDDQKLQSLIRDYINGQFQFYCTASRYRLSELNLGLA
ncbi:hypothetical protein N7456_007329 [Penicillium angulare]|uniref:Terpenoid synthase n=1 Tax=Penicillium angulare TaxID=116970 RepID=A0A9W9FAH5_9EURO|nr:hypothetical protein N7456_007329 [Penicillium angulare]